MNHSLWCKSYWRGFILYVPHILGGLQHTHIENVINVIEKIK